MHFAGIVDGNVIVNSPKLVNDNQNMPSSGLVSETTDDSTCAASSSLHIVPYTSANSSATIHSQEKSILKIHLVNPSSKHIKSHRRTVPSHKRIFSSSVRWKMPRSIPLLQPHCNACVNCPSQNHKFSDNHAVSHAA